MFHAGRYVRSAGSMEALLDSRGGAQDRKIIGGAYQMSTILASRLAGRVRTGAHVTCMDHIDDHVRITLADGSAVTSRCVIVAAPPHIVANLTVTPPLPAKKLRLLQHSLPGAVVDDVSSD